MVKKLYHIDIYFNARGLAEYIYLQHQACSASRSDHNTFQAN
jgi:hypothetical protein